MCFSALACAGMGLLVLASGVLKRERDLPGPVLTGERTRARGRRRLRCRVSSRSLRRGRVDRPEDTVHRGDDVFLDAFGPDRRQAVVDHRRRPLVAPFLEDAERGDVGHHVVAVAETQVCELPRFRLIRERVVDDHLAAEEDPGQVAEPPDLDGIGIVVGELAVFPDLLEQVPGPAGDVEVARLRVVLDLLAVGQAGRTPGRSPRKPGRSGPSIGRIGAARTRATRVGELLAVAPRPARASGGGAGSGRPRSRRRTSPAPRGCASRARAGRSPRSRRRTCRSRAPCSGRRSRRRRARTLPSALADAEDRDVVVDRALEGQLRAERGDVGLLVVPAVDREVGTGLSPRRAGPARARPVAAADDVDDRPRPGTGRTRRSAAAASSSSLYMVSRLVPTTGPQWVCEQARTIRSRARPWRSWSASRIAVERSRPIPQTSSVTSTALRPAGSSSDEGLGPEVVHGPLGGLGPRRRSRPSTSAPWA